MDTSYTVGASPALASGFQHLQSVLVPLTEEIQGLIQTVKEMFRSTKDGNPSVSAYDTACVAITPALDGSAGPQFPKCLGWILQNQLKDGSWGINGDVFLASDRILSTLACVIALKTWSAGDANIIAKGLKFLETNMPEELDLCLTASFKIVFPALLEKAKSVGIELPYQLSFTENLQKERATTLKRLKYESENGSYPAAILQCLEGLDTEHVEWKKVLEQQEKNGSIMFSPASTVCALMHTGDVKCLEYLNKLLAIFENAVPSVYPIDLRERLCMVDRMQQLGISRYFESEIAEFLDYVYRHWTSDGIAWAKQASFQDLDDTALAFRLLRLNGYSVSPDVFYRFNKPDGTFSSTCLADQDDDEGHPISTMCNVLKASQLSFTGETVLDELEIFAKRFLLDKLQSNNNKTWDSRVLMKELPKEVEYALNYPSHARLQRLEARHYLECYGMNDAWIGKTLYRLPNVNNVSILNLAKEDFNFCQTILQAELQQLARWAKDCKFYKIDYARQKTTELYFAIAATMFEPELSIVRLAWAKCGILVTVLDDFFDVGASSDEIKQILEAIKGWDPTLIRSCSEQGQILFMGFYNTANSIIQEACGAQGRDISSHMRRMWVDIIYSHFKEAEWVRLRYLPSLEKYMDVGVISIEAESCLLSSIFLTGIKVTDDYLSHSNYKSVIHLVSTIFRLQNDVQGYERESSEGKSSSVVLYLHENPGATHEEALNYFKHVIDKSIKELRLILFMQKGVPKVWRELYWNMVKFSSLFFLNTDGLSSPTAMKKYVDKVLFSLVL